MHENCIFQIVEKIRIQMDSFLEDGSHEATIAILRALCLAVPQATEKLKDYILRASLISFYREV